MISNQDIFQDRGGVKHDDINELCRTMTKKTYMSNAKNGVYDDILGNLYDGMPQGECEADVVRLDAVEKRQRSQIKQLEVEVAQQVHGYPAQKKKPPPRTLQ